MVFSEIVLLGCNICRYSHTSKIVNTYAEKTNELINVVLQIIATIMYVLVTYFMTMQPTELFRLTFFLIMCVLVSLVAQSFGLFIGASMNIKVRKQLFVIGYTQS